MYDVKLLIGGKEQTAGAARPSSDAIRSVAMSFHAPLPPRRTMQSRRSRPRRRRFQPGRRRARERVAQNSTRPRICSKQRAADFAAAVRDETGSTAGWGHFNVHFAASHVARSRVDDHPGVRRSRAV